MQSNLIYIYENKTDVQISDGFDGTRNQIVYAADLILHKNIDNVLYFQAKNADQRRTPIGNKSFTFVVFDDRKGYEGFLIQMPAVVTDAITGKFRVTVPEQYLYDVELGKYQYSIRMNDVDGSSQAVYTDDNYGVRGVVDVRRGSAPLFTPSDTLTFDALTDLTDVVGEITNVHQNNALHTALIKFDDAAVFTGDVTVEGTMDNITNQFPANVNFFDIATINFVDQVDNMAFNFNGVYSGVRFKQENITSGSITELIYRF